MIRVYRHAFNAIMILNYIQDANDDCVYNVAASVVLPALWPRTLIAVNQSSNGPDSFTDVIFGHKIAALLPNTRPGVNYCSPINTSTTSTASTAFQTITSTSSTHHLHQHLSQSIDACHPLIDLNVYFISIIIYFNSSIYYFIYVSNLAIFVIVLVNFYFFLQLY